MNVRIYGFSQAIEFAGREWISGGRIVLDAQGKDRSELRFPLKGLKSAQRISVFLRAELSEEGFGKCFVGADFFTLREKVINLALFRKGKDVPNEFCGHYQIYKSGIGEYRFDFIVPFGADECEIVFTVKEGALLQIEDMHFESDAPVMKTNGGIKFVSHLGMTGYAPKNTMPAFRMTCAGGYRECVTNTNYTLDGYLVALHDNTIDATSNGTGKIREMTLSEARRFDFGEYANPVYRNTYLPELSEVLMLMKENGVRPVLRLGDFTGDGAKYLSELEKLCEKTGHTGNMTAKAFKMEVLEDFRRISGEETRYGLCTDELTEEKAVWLKKLSKNVYFDIRYTRLTDEMLEIARYYGIPVECWIINEFDRIIEFSRKGVSGFTTDFYPMDGYAFEE